MEQPKIIHSTFVVERSFPKPPETVFAAFADPRLMCDMPAARATHCNSRKKFSAKLNRFHLFRAILPAGDEIGSAAGAS